MKNLTQYCIVLTLLFVCIDANADSQLITETKDVWTLNGAAKAYQCGDSTPSPQCAAVSFFQCRDAYDLKHCDLIGIPPAKYKAFYEQFSPHRIDPAKRLFRFEVDRVQQSKQGHDLPDWLKPKAAFIYAGEVNLENQNEYAKVVGHETDVSEFHYFQNMFAFKWQDGRWQLGKWESHYLPEGCEIDSSVYKIKDPFCFEYTWSKDEWKTVKQVFFGS